jgi:hypothetical protein
MKKLWRIWARTMGEKISEDVTEADMAAAIRTFWWFVHITTCGFIIANTIRHWNS